MKPFSAKTTLVIAALALVILLIIPVIFETTEDTKRTTIVLILLYVSLLGITFLLIARTIDLEIVPKAAKEQEKEVIIASLERKIMELQGLLDNVSHKRAEVSSHNIEGIAIIRDLVQEIVHLKGNITPALAERITNQVLTTESPLQIKLNQQL